MAKDKNFKQRNNYEDKSKIELKKIELDYKNNPQLFGKIAEEWSKQIEKEGSRNKNINKINQIRSFYDKVIELQTKADGISDDTEYTKKVFPFVVMLKSKVAYAKTRNLVSSTFVDMINQCVDEATTKDKMLNFKYFFEAVIGFYPRSR